MEFDIRKNIINNFKNCNADTIIKTINDTLNENDELILPGLGVLFELYWKKIDDNKKLEIAKTIIKNLS